MLNPEPQELDGAHSSVRIEVPSNNEQIPRNQNTKRKHLGLLRQWIVSVMVSTSYLIIGTSVGWTSPVLYNLRQTGVPLSLTETDVSVMTSLFYVGNIILPIPGGYLCDWAGRRGSLLILTVMPLGSWVLIYLANHPAYLHVAKLLAGCWGGLVRTVLPLYMGELVEPKVRGAVSTLATILVNFGLLLSFVVGPYVSYWTLALFCGSIPLLFFTMVAIYVPESPYWLVSQRAEGKAEKNLVWLRGGLDNSGIQEEMQQIVAGIESDRTQSKNVLTLCKSKGLRRAFFIMEVLAISQRLSGIGAVVAYTSITLPDKKVGPLSPNECVIVIGVARLITIILILLVIDRFGRIPLLIISCVGCGFSMSVLSLWFFFHRSTKEYTLHWIPFVCFLCYGCFFNVGLGPIPTTIQGEIFPSRVKALASGITAIVYACTSAIVNFVYIPIANHLGLYVNYTIYSVSCFVCLIFVTTFMFETKRKTLYEIQQELHALRIPRSRGRRTKIFSTPFL